VRPTGPAGDRALRAKGEFALQQLLRAALSHDQHDQVGRRPADLEPDAAAFDANGTGSRPARAALVATRQVPFPVLSAKDERGRLEIRNDHDAMRLLEQILGNALVRRRHDLGEHGRGRAKSLNRFVVCGNERRHRQRRRHDSRSNQSHVAPAFRFAR
jgi:hypothetical protein